VNPNEAARLLSQYPRGEEFINHDVQLDLIPITMENIYIYIYIYIYKVKKVPVEVE
jgi:hypothetical protein